MMMMMNDDDDEDDEDEYDDDEDEEENDDDDDDDDEDEDEDEEENDDDDDADDDDDDHILYLHMFQTLAPNLRQFYIDKLNALTQCCDSMPYFEEHHDTEQLRSQSDAILRLQNL